MLHPRPRIGHRDNGHRDGSTGRRLGLSDFHFTRPLMDRISGSTVRAAIVAESWGRQ
jgi:hypothetical protein